MAIRNNLALIMAKRKIFSLEDISKGTGLNKNTLSLIRHNKAKGIDYRTLEALCTYFEVQISEMLVIEDEAS
ncbi:hypothetical protein A8709_33075 [Paenibacillus pectinilyticus]|uniref:HTH cro/C1-type domain-containing protein n=1 Tax=Paenibacillus pectinilyticus TaxID=512399 RepID=A0A1C0ZX19_9BACL|nr:helix-turn-helix transcriptional regulator [Paenibacillus pectinilyticus]OCT12645.1 hypothetical protein A8709_33075 [Paenibacillus pectinilyticus]